MCNTVAAGRFLILCCAVVSMLRSHERPVGSIGILRVAWDALRRCMASRSSRYSTMDSERRRRGRVRGGPRCAHAPFCEANQKSIIIKKECCSRSAARPCPPWYHD
ncbi:hypothetical protein BC828DRAFT_33113 [Blastocladiella britannica]|nr:hypothetical protein BC828DRAFT_33113 [Blastocladiella britannica]